MLLLLFGALVAATAQDQTDESQVFAPFISRLRVSVRDPLVRLTWEDAEDVSGPYLVYRHTEQITSDNIGETTLVASVEAGEESLIDEPEFTGSYFYAVLAQMEENVPYPIFIPGRNATYNAVTIVNTESVPERVAVVTSISTEITTLGTQPAIRIGFEADKEDRTLIVYRSTSPFASTDDITGSSVVRETSSESGSLIDIPVPGVPYYYAIADTEAVLEGTVAFVADGNTTGQPVEIPIEMLAAAETAPEPDTEGPEEQPADQAADEAADQAADEAVGADAGEPVTEPASEEAEEEAETPVVEQAIAVAPAVSLAPISSTSAIEAPPELPSDVAPVLNLRPSRPLPLPFLALRNEVATGDDLADLHTGIPSRRMALSDEAREGVASLIHSLRPLPPQVVYPAVLEDDSIPEPQGAEFTLRTIVDGPFANRSWQEAVEQLGYYFALPLTPELRARAHFYRAQAYYFLGDQQLAFAEFLLARDHYYVEVRPWLDLILNSSSGA